MTTTQPGPDPQWGMNNAIVTTTWRDPVVNQPENAIIGVMFESVADGSYVVQNADSWVYNNTGFVNGSSIPGIVGYEYDKVWNNGMSPAGLTVLSNSPVTDSGGVSSFSNSTIYTAASGARVFASGTIEWSLGLATLFFNPNANAGIQQTTANILDNFIMGTIPVLSLSSNSISFNGGVVGILSGAHRVTVTNTGTGTLNLGSITIAGSNPGDFSQTNNCSGAIGFRASCTIDVAFKATATGNRSAILSLADNARNSPQSIALTGIGQATAAPLVTLVPTSITFGPQHIFTSSTAQTVAVANIGTAPLSIGNITLTGGDSGDFTEANNCPRGSDTLAVNASCTISIAFAPILGGARSAGVSIADNAGDSPQVVSVGGTGAMVTVYFSDGFESGDFSSWNLPSGDSAGQRIVQTAVVSSGRYAAALTNSSGQYSNIYTALSSGAEAQSFTKFSFRLTDSMTATMLAAGCDVNGNEVWEVDYDESSQGLDVYFWDGFANAYSIFTAPQSIAANTWYTLELQDSEISNGQGAAWLNGMAIGAINADLSTTTPLARLMLYNQSAGTAYFDDVSVTSEYQ